MTLSQSASVTIPRRFCGPPRSGNGGYTAGLLGDLLPGPCEVTLRAPPPLDIPLELTRVASDRASLEYAGDLLAEAQRLPALELQLPAAVDIERAARASRGYPGYAWHPLPGCFVCGTERKPGDGLCLYPGPVEPTDGDAGLRLAAAVWEPDAGLSSDGDKVDARFVWAALDCPAWFGFVSFAAEVPATLLGRIAVSIAERPRIAEPCSVVGWNLGREGRRILCASALFARDGRCLAYSRSTWIALRDAPPTPTTT